MVYTDSKGSITREVCDKIFAYYGALFFEIHLTEGFALFEIVWCALILKGFLREKYVPCDKIFAYYGALFF